jgi:ABC-type uncharacterized transport system substrate-binding protein
MNLRRRSFLQAGSLTLFLSRAGEAQAADVDLRIVLGADSAAQRQILEALRRRHPNALADQAVEKLKRAGRTPVYVAIGPAALKAALATDLDGPLVSLFTSRQVYGQFVVAAAGAAASRRITAIYAEPSPDQQLQVIAAIYRRRVVVGSVLSEESAYLRPLLQDAARKHNLQLDLHTAATASDLPRALTSLASANVLLISPDSGLYTQQNLREFLEATYRRRQPVVGFSASLVAAGTLASAYSDLEDVLAELDAVLDGASSGRLPEPQYPRYWRVAINDSVARSLNVVIDDAVRTTGNRP